MSDISRYPTADSVKLNDKLVGTSVGGEPVDATKNFLISQIVDFVSNNVSTDNITVDTINLEKSLYRKNIKEITSNYTATINDDVIIVKNVGVTVNLPLFEYPKYNGKTITFIAVGLSNNITGNIAIGGDNTPVTVNTTYNPNSFSLNGHTLIYYSGIWYQI